MSKAVVDHLWTNIADDNYIGRIAITDKLEEIERYVQRLDQAEDSDVVKKLRFDVSAVRCALTRCNQFHHKEADLNQMDLHINYRYATDSMFKVQPELDDFFADSGL